MDNVRVSKVTISLPPSVLKFADLLAREKSTTRSGVIADLLEKEGRARTEAHMAEGYREMAEENGRLAEESFPLVSEALEGNTRWYK